MKKIALGCLLTPILVAIALAVTLTACYQTKARGRAEWMRTALPRLAALSVTNDEISTELRELRTAIRDPERPAWTGDHVVLMTNGEYLIYLYRHGANDSWPHHLFLARGSDNRWFYSSYHFCNGSLGMIKADEPAGSIDEFTTRYGIRKFDGKSDECLKPTKRPKTQ